MGIVLSVVVAIIIDVIVNGGWPNKIVLHHHSLHVDPLLGEPVVLLVIIGLPV